MANVAVDSPKASRAHADAPVRSELQKLIIGGVGGTAPIVATLVAGEYDNTAEAEAAYLYDVGLVLRALLFFGVGAFFVWLHDAVRTRYAVFQLGVAAPALIVAMVHANPVQPAEVQTAAAHGAFEVRLASLESTERSTAFPDSLSPDILFAKCSILDGLLGRKCGD